MFDYLNPRPPGPKNGATRMVPRSAQKYNDGLKTSSQGTTML